MLHCFLFLLFLNSDWSNYYTFRCNHLARGDYNRDTKFENDLSQKKKECKCFDVLSITLLEVITTGTPNLKMICHKKKKNVNVLTFCQCKGRRRFRKFNSEELKRCY